MVMLYMLYSSCRALLLCLGAEKRHGPQQIRILIRACAGVWWSEAITGFLSYNWTAGFHLMRRE